MSPRLASARRRLPWVLVLLTHAGLAAVGIVVLFSQRRLRTIAAALLPLAPASSPSIARSPSSGV